MNPAPGCVAAADRGGDAFATTHWSLVLAAREQGSPGGEKALGRLCSTYWFPLYSYVRRRGHSPHDAEDLTQEFFARLVRKEFLAHLTRDGGKFRAFLLTALKRFLANDWNRAHAQRRGGAVKIVSWEDGEGEQRYAREPSECVTPEKLFERRWALTVLDTVMRRLEQEYDAAGRRDVFALLQPCIAGGRDAVRPEDIGARHAISPGAVRVAVHRMRRRYGELLRAEVAQTVGSGADVDAEIRYLITVACL